MLPAAIYDVKFGLVSMMYKKSYSGFSASAALTAVPVSGNPDIGLFCGEGGDNGGGGAEGGGDGCGGEAGGLGRRGGEEGDGEGEGQETSNLASVVEQCEVHLK